MTILAYAVLVFVVDALAALLAGWYLDARQQRQRVRAVRIGGLIALVGGINLLSFISAGWWMLVPSVLGSMVGDWLSFE